MEPYRVGIVGLGQIAQLRHLPILTQHPRLRVVAATDIDPQRAEVAAHFHIEHFIPEASDLIALPDCDLIAIFTPPTTHAELAIAALDAGKHVFMEKPLTLDAESGERIAFKAQDASSKVCVGFNQRHHRLVRAAREWIQQGRLGEIVALQTTWTTLGTAGQGSEWRSQTAQGGDLIFDLAVHHFDSWRFLLGAEITVVMAQAASHTGAGQALTLLGKMSNGVPVTMLIAAGTAEQNALEIFGSKGNMRVALYRHDGLQFIPRGAYDGSFSLRRQQAKAFAVELPKMISRMRQGGDMALSYAVEWDAFVAAMDGKQPVEASVEDGLRVTQAAVAAQASLEDGVAMYIE